MAGRIAPAAHRLAPAAHRVRQGLTAVAALRPRPHPEDDALADHWLPPHLRPLFDRMAPHDRAHACRVARAVATGGGPVSADLVVAALLHDVGKAGTPTVPGRVRLPDRTARVLLARLAPATLRRLTRRPSGTSWANGLYLATHHARLGADLAREAGASGRVVDLIARHEESDPTDPELRRLVAADTASV